jgi:hypothetical protein
LNIPSDVVKGPNDFNEPFAYYDFNDGIIANCQASGSANGDSSIGGLCGQNLGTISNCTSGTSVTGGNDPNQHIRRSFGGLCGSNVGIIVSSSASGPVTVTASNEPNAPLPFGIGGLCGESAGILINCTASGPVYGEPYSSDVGGLCGSAADTINGCNASGSVDGFGDVGGLCGYAFACTISACFSTGDVNGTIYVGGLCGMNAQAEYPDPGEETTIINCYSSSDVTGPNDANYLGGLCGVNWIAEIDNCYASGSVTAGAGSANLGGLCGGNLYSGTISGSYFLDPNDGGGPDNGLGTPLTDTQMKKQASFVGWDFVNETINGSDDIWTIKEDVRYPEFAWRRVQLGGSFNGVEFSDYSFLSGYYGRTDCNECGDCYGADIDFSGKVDINDLAIFNKYWLFGK